MLACISYFTISLALFLVVFISCFLFGFFFLNTLFPIFKTKKLDLQFTLLSFGVGVVIFIWYAYLIDTFFIFNFYTIILPIFIINLGFFLYCYKFNPNFRERCSKQSLDSIIKKFKQHESLLLILISAICLGSFLLFFRLSWFYSYLSKDPYIWFYNTKYLIQNGNLDYEEIGGYSAGMVFYVGACTLLVKDYMTFFFFLKYNTIFFFSINTTVVFYISNKIFKNKVFIFFTLLIFLSFNLMFYRYLIGAPSSLATTIAFIFLLTFEFKDNYQIFILKGIILAGIYLFHPLMAFFFLIVYFIFIFFDLMIKILANNKLMNKKSSLLSLVKTTIKSLFFTILFFFLSLIPYLINQIFKNPSGIPIIETISFYFKDLNAIYIPNNNHFLALWQNPFEFFMYWFVRGGNNYFRDIGFNSPILTQINDLYSKSLSFGLIFIVIGFFISYKTLIRKNLVFDNQTQLILFIKTSFLFSISYFLLLGLVQYLKIEELIPGYYLFNNYRFRPLELFEGFWSIFFTFSLFIFKEKIKKMYIRIINMGRKVKIEYQNTKNKRVVFYISILLIGSFFYFTNFQRTYFNSYYEDEEINEVFWEMGKYFDSYSITKEQNLLIQKITPPSIYRQISYHTNLNLIKLEFNNSMTYTAINIDKDEIDYIMVDKNIISEELMDNITKHFDTQYENSDYFFGVKD